MKKLRLLIKFYWHNYILRADVFTFYSGVPVIKGNGLDINLTPRHLTLKDYLKIES